MGNNIIAVLASTGSLKETNVLGSARALKVIIILNRLEYFHALLCVKVNEIE